MTLSAEEGERSPYGKTIKVRFGYGPITAELTETVEHTRNFWAELGRLLDRLEHEDA